MMYIFLIFLEVLNDQNLKKGIFASGSVHLDPMMLDVPVELPDDMNTEDRNNCAELGKSFIYNIN